MENACLIMVKGRDKEVNKTEVRSYVLTRREYR